MAKSKSNFQLNNGLKSFINNKASSRNDGFGFFKVYFWWMFGMLASKFELSRFYGDEKITRKDQKKIRNYYFASFQQAHNSKIKREMSWEVHFYIGLFIFWLLFCLIIAGIAILGSAEHSLQMYMQYHDITGHISASSYYGVGGAFVGIGIVGIILMFIVSFVTRNFYFYGRKPLYEEANAYDVSRSNITRDNDIVD